MNWNELIVTILGATFGGLIGAGIVVSKWANKRDRDWTNRKDRDE